MRTSVHSPESHGAALALRSGAALTDAQRDWLRPRFVGMWVEKPSGCWEWLGTRFSNGYGLVQVGGAPTVASRVAFAWWHGPIPVGLEVCHTCDNRCCVNPGHLFAGTSKDNADDRTAKGRTLRGADHSSTRLTAAQVSDIRRRYAPGRPCSPTIVQSNTQRALAREFGVSKSQIARIVRRESRTGADGVPYMVAQEITPGVYVKD